MITLTRLGREIPPNINPNLILANITGNNQFLEYNTATKCIEIYKNTHDKKAFKNLFKATTGVEYPDFIYACSGENL